MLRHIITVAATVAALSACGESARMPMGGSPVAEPLSDGISSAHVTFHFAAGDSVDVERQEALHDWVTPRLRVSLPGKIRYFKYRDRAHMAAHTGRSANGFAEPERLEIHSIFPWHAHEAVHVYSALVGRPSDFFNEGLAVALTVDPVAGRFDGVYRNEPVHDWVRRNLDRLRPIASMATTDDFRRVDESVAYQEAGSFMQFLIDSEGYPGILELFRRGRRGDDLETIRSTFQASLGFSLQEAEQRWQTFLRTDR